VFFSIGIFNIFSVVVPVLFCDFRGFRWVASIDAFLVVVGLFSSFSGVF
jgi:hypothetical protein